MAGSLAMIVREEEDSSAIREQWEIQYARFFNYPSLLLPSTTTLPDHLQLRRFFKKPDRNSKGTWISTLSTVSLQLEHSASDAILTVSFQGRILEEHFMSKLNFTWPHVSCVSGFPTRGSRAVFVSYRDDIGETQKFALRFSTTYDTEGFVKNIKPTNEDAVDVSLPSCDIASEFSCLSEFIHTHGSTYGSSEEFSITAPIETSTTEIPYESGYVDEQLSNSQETAPSYYNEGQIIYTQEIEPTHQFNVTDSGLPPSFTSLLTNCCSQSNKEEVTDSKELDFKAQVAKYMEDSSFLDMFVKVEKVVNELEDDLMMSSCVDLH